MVRQIGSLGHSRVVIGSDLDIFGCVLSRFRLDGRYISADVYSFGLAWSKELSASRT